MRIYIFLISLLFFPILAFSQDTISKPQHSVISLDKVKVVYRGIDNPITVAVTNAKSYTVSGSSVFLNKDETYSIRPGVGLETKVYVEIILEDDSFVVEEYIYQIKNLPSLLTTINDQFSTQGYLEFSIEELKNAKIGVKLVDFMFINNYPTVSGFTIKISNKDDFYNEGNLITDEAINLLKKARKNDLIILRDVKWSFSGVSASNKPLSTVIIKIIK